MAFEPRCAPMATSCSGQAAGSRSGSTARLWRRAGRHPGARRWGFSSTQNEPLGSPTGAGTGGGSRKALLAPGDGSARCEGSRPVSGPRRVAQRPAPPEFVTGAGKGAAARPASLKRGAAPPSPTPSATAPLPHTAPAEGQIVLPALFGPAQLLAAAAGTGAVIGRRVRGAAPAEGWRCERRAEPGSGGALAGTANFGPSPRPPRGGGAGAARHGASGAVLGAGYGLCAPRGCRVAGWAPPSGRRGSARGTRRWGATFRSAPPPKPRCPLICPEGASPPGGLAASEARPREAPLCRARSCCVDGRGPPAAISFSRPPFPPVNFLIV
ncbi:skin secretory protein xP2-like [Pezoporus flaviventris]|uniref:skin secretory protein xP2-like n=1 Tax=Pezoporus flaviventris TaxID=889875 RepID=UPI002AB0B26A|nr:skin secretory protein xP2-like [Pezoporus flaviventris]